MSNKFNGISAKSAALILVLLAAAIGITGFLTGRSKEQVQEVTLQEPMLENLTESTQPALSVTQPTKPAVPSPTVSTVPQVKATEPIQQTVPQPTQEPVRKVFTTTHPVSGNTIGEYAMDCLSYNETTRDWRIHNGIDLAAEEGSPVCAAADGTVYTTYEDDTLGYTVVIRHEGGYTTRYSSLREDLAVKPGDTVTLGQTIGYAGDSAIVESVMGSHVHFSASCQDIPMDPEEFFALS